MTSIWNEELQNSVKSLWMEGKSAAQIGKLHNISRNTIIGKVRRMGLVRNPQAKDLKIKLDTRYPEIESPHVVVGGVPMTELSYKGCLFAVTPHNAKTHLFCNAERQTVGAYCTEHQTVCVRVSNERPL